MTFAIGDDSRLVGDFSLPEPTLLLLDGPLLLIPTTFFTFGLGEARSACSAQFFVQVAIMMVDPMRASSMASVAVLVSIEHILFL